MGSSTVVLVKCDTYDQEEVRESIEEGLDLLGGIHCFVKPGERIEPHRKPALAGLVPEYPPANQRTGAAAKG